MKTKNLYFVFIWLVLFLCQSKKTIAENSVCNPVFNIEVIEIESSKATITWDETGEALSYTIEYGSKGFLLGTGLQVIAATKPNVLINLIPETEYDVYIRAICDGGQTSTWSGPKSFKTKCANTSLPYRADLANFLPDFCWSMKSDNKWHKDEGYRGGLMQSVSIPLRGNSVNSWIQSPKFDLENEHYRLEINVAVTRSVTNNEPSIMGPDDKVELQISSNNGFSWDTLFIWNASNQPGINGQNHVFDLSAYSGEIQFRLLADNTISYWGYSTEFHLGRFNVVPADACSFAYDIESLNTGPNSEIITWQDSGLASYWIVEYDSVGFIPTTGNSLFATSKEKEITGLEYNTTYSYYVYSICGSSISIPEGPYLFSTGCEPFPIPYCQSFENSSLDACWDVLDMNSDGNSWKRQSFNSVHGYYSFGMYLFEENDDWFVSSAIELNGNERLRYYVKSNDTLIYHLKIGMSQDDTSSFSDIFIDTVFNTDYKEVNVDLSAYSGNYYFAWHTSKDSTYPVFRSIYLDSICWENTPTCESPKYVQTTSVDRYTAELTWTEIGSASSWEVAHGPAGITPDVATKVMTSNDTLLLTGLSSNTQYDVYVRSICGAGNTSSFRGPIKFQTICETFTVPFCESFNNDGNCWGIINAYDNYYQWTLSAFGYNSLDNFGYAQYSNYDAQKDDWLISPSVTLTGNQQVRFYIKSTGTIPFQLRLSNSGVDTVNFSTILMDDTLTYNSQYHEINIDLSAFTGDVNLAWYIPTTTFTGGVFYLDSICIEDIPSCFKPNDLTAISVGQDTAVLQWTESGTAAEWHLEVGEKGFSLGDGNRYTVSSNPAVLSGLLSNTELEVYARSYCSVGDSSLWVGPTLFKTDCGVFTPDYFTEFPEYMPLDCWTVGQGGDAISGPSSTGYSSWYNGSDVYSGKPAARVGFIACGGFFSNNGSENTSSTALYCNPDEWLISPLFDLSNNDYQLEVEAAYAGDIESDDKLLILISEDEGNSWEVLQEWNELNINLTGTLAVIDLSAYSDTVQLAIVASDGDVAPSNSLNFYVGQFDIRLLNSCSIPDSINAVVKINSSADISWRENGNANAWKVQLSSPYSLDDFYVQNTPHLNLSNLLSNTEYEISIRSICGTGDSSYYSLTSRFKTLCDVRSEFCETFDSSDALECWTIINGGTSDQWRHQNSSMSLYTNYNLGDNDDWLISPRIVLNGSQQLRYSQLSASSFDKNHYELRLSGNGIDTNDFNTIIRIDTVETYGFGPGSYEEVVINLEHISDTVFLAWRVPPGNPDGERLIIDNVCIEEVPDCALPDSIQVNNITPFSADLNWIDYRNALSFEVEYGKINFVQGEGTILNTNNTNVALSGLSPSTGYEFYVRAHCLMNASTSWVGPFEFYTGCPVYTNTCEGFEYLSVSKNCWMSVNEVGGFHWDLSSFGQARKGSFKATINTNGSNGNMDTWLISPSFELNGTQQVRYYIEGLSSNTTVRNNYILKLSTGGPSLDSFTHILMYDTTSSHTYEERILDLTSFSGNVHLALHIPLGSLDGPGLNLDEFCIEERPSCPKPKDFEIVDIEPNQVTLTWIENGTATEWYLMYGLAGDLDLDTVLVTENPHVVTGLNQHTNYRFKVASVCAMNDVSQIAFTDADAGTISLETDCGGVYLAPYYEDAIFFSGINYGYDFDNCWSSTTNSGFVFSWQSSISHNPPYEGPMSTGPQVLNSSRRFWMTNGEGSLYSSDTLYTAPIDISALNQPTLLFEYHMYGADMGTLKWEISDDLGTSWQHIDSLVGQQHLSIGAPWTETEYSIQNTGDTVTVRFVAIRGDGIRTKMAFDRLRVVEGISCKEPTNPIVTSSTADSFTLDWIEQGNATSWVLEYGELGFALGTGTRIVTSTKPFTVSGFDLGQNFDVYVQSICAVGDTSNLAGPVRYFAPCNYFSAPYEEHFDHASAHCWEKAGNHYYSVEITDQLDYVGGSIPSLPNVVELNDGLWSGGDTAAYVTPRFSDLGSGLNRVRFKVAFEEIDNENEKLFVGTVNDLGDMSSFMPYDTISGLYDLAGQRRTFVEIVIDLDDTTKIQNNSRVAFIHGDGFWEIYLDDFYYEKINACQTQRHLTGNMTDGLYKANSFITSDAKIKSPHSVIYQAKDYIDLGLDANGMHAEFEVEIGAEFQTKMLDCNDQ